MDTTHYRCAKCEQRFPVREAVDCSGAGFLCPLCEANIDEANKPLTAIQRLFYGGILFVGIFFITPLFPGIREIDRSTGFIIVGIMLVFCIMFWCFSYKTRKTPLKTKEV